MIEFTPRSVEDVPLPSAGKYRLFMTDAGTFAQMDDQGVVSPIDTSANVEPYVLPRIITNRAILGGLMNGVTIGPDCEFVDAAAFQAALGQLLYSDGTAIDDLRPAAAGATVGAPSGTNVAGRAAADIASTVASGGGVATNQVSTGSIVSRAVTAPSGIFTPGALTVIAAAGFTTVQTLNYTATGEVANIILSYGFDPGPLGGLYYDVRLLRNGSQIWAAATPQWAAYYNSPMVFTFQLMDTPSAGPASYVLQVSVYAGGAGSGNLIVRDRSITSIEFKK